MRKTSSLRLLRSSFLLAALVAGLVAIPRPGRGDNDPKKQSPKPLVTSQAEIPAGGRFPEAKPTFTGRFSSVRVDKTVHKDENGHEGVTEVRMYIPWDTDPAKQVRLQIGKPDDTTGKPVSTTYRVLQIHMHRHSEHTIDGPEYDRLEMHCVLTDNNGTASEPTAALGFLIVVRPQQNNGLNFYFDNVARPNGTVNLPAPQDLNDVLPQDMTYFSYHGSLTTPSLVDMPLNTTPILWYVLKNKIQVSDEQYNKYARAVEPQFRIPQLNNDSKVWLIIPQPLGEQ
jgi:carbonic anhydrase